jgi:hypothetical protein
VVGERELLDLIEEVVSKPPDRSFRGLGSEPAASTKKRRRRYVAVCEQAAIPVLTAATRYVSRYPFMSRTSPRRRFLATALPGSKAFTDYPPKT